MIPLTRMLSAHTASNFKHRLRKEGGGKRSLECGTAYFCSDGINFAGTNALMVNTYTVLSCLCPINH